MLSNKIAPPFMVFSGIHLITIAVLFGLFLLLYLTKEMFKRNNPDKAVRYVVATLLILLEISTIIVNIVNGSWSWTYSLPLQLCDILAFLSALLLITKSYRLYEYVYFLGLAGASQALITPDLIQGFPSVMFFEFFINHGLIIFSALYMTFVHDYRPRLRSILRTLVGLNLVVPLIGLINYFTGGDYFFLAWKPQTASLLNYLGPWPWYILSLEFVAIALFFLLYLPFAFANMRRSRDKREKFSV